MLTEQEIKALRSDFPILKTQVRGKPLVYFDNAATTQKPKACIDAINHYYQHENANVHRGIHYLSEKATEKYEATRALLANFIHAPSPSNLVFTKGATESINLIAHGFSESLLNEGDEIIISAMEHHANLIPWQMACKKTGAILKIVDLHEDSSLNLSHLHSLISKKTKLISICWVSNSLGNINPIKEIIELAKSHNIPILIDAAQAISHLEVNVKDLDCDFLVFSAHKMYGPTGVGALYAKSKWLERLPPYQGGGDMIMSVDFQSFTYQAPPHKFEAGTPNISGVIAWGASIDYLNHLNLKKIHAYEQALADELDQRLNAMDFVEIVSQAKIKISTRSFICKNAHSHDIATILDDDGIAIRAGHHCTMPLMNYLGLSATARASLCFYNTIEEIESFIQSLKKIARLFQ